MNYKYVGPVKMRKILIFYRINNYALAFILTI